MSSTWEADGLVNARSTNIDRYKRNFLKQAVCELRFPTLMELGESKPPATLVNALRKDYPHLELGNEVTIGIAGGPNGANHVHTMRSSKGAWAVSVKQSSLTIETTAYSEFAQMKARVLQVVRAAEKVIDTDFFTRIGLRYINVIDSGTDPAIGWVNPALVEPLRAGIFTTVQEYAGKMLLAAPDGGCLLQHGVRAKPSVDGKMVAPEYFIDIDTFRTDILVGQVEDALEAMHTQGFDMFDWSIGPAAREYLMAEKPVKNKGQ